MTHQALKDLVSLKYFEKSVKEMGLKFLAFINKYSRQMLGKASPLIHVPVPL